MILPLRTLSENSKMIEKFSVIGNNTIYSNEYVE